jgi:hypothetical protein
MRFVLGAAVLALVYGMAGDGPARPSTATGETIDCLPAASSGGVPRGEGRFPVWRIQGAIGGLNLLHRTFRMTGVTLSVDANTVIPIDCARAPLRELREGAEADAVYEERDGRNVVIVLEAERQAH